MYISVNKKTVARRPVKYAALNAALSGSSVSSGIWHDEETNTANAPRRTNRIKLNSQKRPQADDFDA